jgi:hypothetical protein
MPSAPQPGGNSSHHEDRKNLRELQSFFFAVFVILKARIQPDFGIRDRLRVSHREPCTL